VGKYGGDDFPSPTQKLLQGVQVAIPDLSGKSPADAQNILKGLGLNYADGGQQDSAQPAGAISATDPAAGTNVGKGTVVTVYTSNASLVALPNVVGQKLSDAQKSLAGFKVSVKGGGNDPNAVVETMDPGAGTAAKQGSTVTLTVKAAAPPAGG
jgi:beta-lactam-binding protein with PASTA domain